MCKQFKVAKILVTTGPATANNHDGKPFTVDTVPVGTVFAFGTDGNLYVSNNDIPEAWGDEMQRYYSRYKRPQELFRDYWRFVMDADTYKLATTQPEKAAPYDVAKANVPHRVFWQASV